MIDLSFLEKFTKGNTDKMKRYINMYLSVAPNTFKAMEQDILNQDWKQLQINAHSLKPQTDFMGLDALKSLLIEIEMGVENKAYESLKILYDEALILHRASEILLQEHVGKL